MSADLIIEIARNTLWVVMKASAPMLITSLVVGLIISVLQTITSIQEQTLTFVPKLIVVFLVIMICGNWIGTTIGEFTVELFTNFNVYIGK